MPSIHPAVEADGCRQPDSRVTTGPFPIANLARFQYEPFVLMYKESTIRAITDEIFRKSGFTPNVLFETASNNTVLSMIEANLCCGVVRNTMYAGCQRESAVSHLHLIHPGTS